MHYMFDVCVNTNILKVTAFWEKAKCSLVEADQRFRGVYYIQLQGDGGSTSTTVHGATSQKAVRRRGSPKPQFTARYLKINYTGS
jgi:hypothetical protein